MLPIKKHMLTRAYASVTPRIDLLSTLYDDPLRGYSVLVHLPQPNGVITAYDLTQAGQRLAISLALRARLWGLTWTFPPWHTLKSRVDLGSFTWTNEASWGCLRDSVEAVTRLFSSDLHSEPEGGHSVRLVGLDPDTTSGSI